MTIRTLLFITALALVWGHVYSGQVWRCRSADDNDAYMDKLCRDRCVKGKCQSYCVCNTTEVVFACASFDDFAPNDFISIDETTAPGTQMFTIPIKDQETWTYSLKRSGSVDGSLWRELQKYFTFRKFGDEYEMIVDKTPDLENINLKYSIQLESLGLSLTCNSPGVPPETRELFVHIRPVNEYAPQFIGLPLVKTIPENTPIGSLVFTMANVTIDRDVNPTTNEISVFRLHKHIPDKSSENGNQNLDSLAYFAMPNVQKGYIAVKENLDYEALSAIGSTRFLLNISAADVHGRLSYTTLRIDIADINDLPPEFVHPSCPSHIPRSRPCPVSFEATVQPGYKGPLHHILPVSIQARDMDHIGDTIVLSLEKGPGELPENAAKFSIDNRTGVVTMQAPFSKPAEIDLVIVAKEDSPLGRTTQAPLRVYVKTDKGIQKLVYPGLPRSSDNDTGNTINIKEEVNDNRMFIIVIAVLSFLVVILIVVSILVLCSMKKDNNTKNKVSPVNNLTFTDHPSSYHYSQDAHNTDDDISEMDSHWSKKSAMKPHFVSVNTNENLSHAGSTVNTSAHNTQGSMSATSSHRSSSFRMKNSKYKNNQTLNGVSHDIPNGNTCFLSCYESSKKNRTMPTDHGENKNEQLFISEHVTPLYYQQSQSKSSTPQIPNKSRAKRHDSQQHTEDNINDLPHPEMHRKYSTTQTPEEARVKNELQGRFDNRSKRAKSYPSAMEAQVDHGSDENATKSLNKSSQHNRNERNGMARNSHKNQDGNYLTRIKSKRDNRSSSTVSERRIRIPSGVLVMKQPVSPEESETSCPDESETNNSHSDVFEDNSSGCGMEMTPSNSTDKPRVSFQLTPTSMTDVLSILLMEHSSGISEDDQLSAKPNSLVSGPNLKLSSSHANGPSHLQNHDPSHTLYTETTNPIRNHSDADTQGRFSDKACVRDGHSISNDIHVPFKPAKLPAIPIGSSKLLRLDPIKSERAYSEDILPQRPSELADTPEAERCRSMGDGVVVTSSIARNKKKRRRALIQNHRDWNASGDPNKTLDNTTNDGSQ